MQEGSRWTRGWDDVNSGSPELESEGEEKGREEWERAEWRKVEGGEWGSRDQAALRPWGDVCVNVG